MPRGAINNYPRSFAFRLTTVDGARLDAVAAAQGTTSGEWARQAVSAALGLAYQRRAMRRRVANADLLRRMLGELGRQGGNLNQVAGRLNADRSLAGEAARDDIAALRAGQKTLVAAIVAVLGGTDRP